MSKNTFRENMGKLIEDDLENIIGDGKEYTNEANDILDKFYRSQKKKERKCPARVFKTVGMAAAVVAALFVGSIMLADVPAVSAVRADFENFFDKLESPETQIDETGTKIDNYASIEEAEAELGALPLTLGWVPEGYEFNGINVVSNNYDNQIVYTYDYYNAEKKPLGYISVAIICPIEYNNISDANFYTDKKISSTEIINGTEVVFFGEKQQEVHFIFNKIFGVSINSDVTKEESVKIIENIE